MDEDARFKDWTFAWELHRKILREWFPLLNDKERLALLFVFDRTVGWGKEWERISRGQCVYGIEDANGKRVATGFASNESRAGAILKRLVDLGMLRASATQSSTDRSRLYALNPDMKFPKNKAEKRDRGGQKCISEGDTSVSLRGTEVSPSNKSSKKKEVSQREERPQPSATEGSPEEAIVELERRTVAVRARSRKRKVEQADRGKKVRDNKTGFVPTRAAARKKWQLLLDEYFPEEHYPAWPPRLESAVVGYAKVWTEARRSGEFYDYLEFVFRYWRQIRVSGFGWMARCPSFPIAELFVSAKLRSIFEIAYAEREKIERMALLNEFDRRVEEVVEKGVDRDVARDQVRQEFGFRDEEKRLKKMKYDIVTLTERMQQQAAVAQTGQGRKRKPLSEMKLEDFTWREEDG